MSREARRFAAAALVLAPALGACSPGPDLPPSIVLVSWDTVRRDHCSLYGYERETTPFLDQLAEESVVYENAYTTASFTLIAHTTMFTGLYPSQHGVDEETAVSPAVPQLAERLRERSYHTVAIFRGGWIDQRFGHDRGFDVFQERNNARLADRAMRDALRDRPRNRPLFLFLHLFDAHCGNISHPKSTVYDPPREYADLFRTGAAERLSGRPAYDLYHGEVPVEPEEALDLVALYDAGIRYLDDTLRDWVALWREEGLFENALLIVTADHGESLGQRGDRWDGHGGFWQEGLRVPLLVRFPDGFGAGTRSERLTSAVDLLPTVLDLLELEPEPWLPGRSLYEDRAPGDVVLAERRRVQAIVDGSHKLTGSRLGRGTRIYDLEQDPLELAPVRGSEMQPHVDRLRAAAEALTSERPPGEAVPAGAVSDEMRADLDAIGYGGEAEPDEDG